MKSQKGFTLVEVVVALGVGVMLVAGVFSAVVSTERAARSQSSDAGREARRTRAIEILRRDFSGRGEFEVEKLVGTRGLEEVPVTLVHLSTTTDSLAPSVRARSVGSLTYSFSQGGVVRVESGAGGASRVVLAGSPVTLEFFRGGMWWGEPGEGISAFRLHFKNPEEVVVLQ